MRFPFTLIGLLCLGFGIWMLAYAVTRRQGDSFLMLAAGVTGAVLIGFGAYRLILSALRGSQS